MKTHLNLGTTDLDRSISFYSKLLDAKPNKVLPDYALFVIDDPGIELALDLRESVRRTTDAHFGIRVETTGEVERAIARLSAVGLASSIEREETCCYANQTKVWATDPEGRRWEVYTVHEETDDRDNLNTTCCSSDGATRSCCAEG
jgi:catechol 2,3-dioxygenase-like lactoylglutathione lyase family enzyme